MVKVQYIERTGPPGNYSEGRSCKCEERKKVLSLRNWTASTWRPYKCYGPNCSNYDGRLLLDLKCNSCGATWRNKNKKSPIWEIIKLSPFGSHPKSINFKEVIRRNGNENQISRSGNGRTMDRRG